MDISGSQVQVRISTDETVANLKDFSNQVIETFRYRPNVQGTDEYKNGNPTRNRVTGMVAPEMDFIFSPNVAADHDWTLLYMQPPKRRAFDVKVLADETGNKGPHLSGVAKFEPGEFSHTVQTRVARSGVTAYSDGPAWTVDDDIS